MPSATTYGTRAQDALGELVGGRVELGGGTTRFTRPHSSAVAASIMSPVNSISSTRLRPIEREIGTIGVEQNRPMFTPGVAKRAASDATARSHAATSWQPAAVATPPTLRDHGLRDRVQALHQRDAGREQRAVELLAPVLDHLGDVVAGRERRARSFEHDDPRDRIGRDRVERADERLHHFERQGVPPLGPVEHEPNDGRPQREPHGLGRLTDRFGNHGTSVGRRILLPNGGSSVPMQGDGGPERLKHVQDAALPLDALEVMDLAGRPGPGPRSRNPGRP